MASIMPHIASAVGTHLAGGEKRHQVARMLLGLLLRYLHVLRLSDRTVRRYGWDARELSLLDRVEKMAAACLETCLQYNQRLVRSSL